MTVVDLPEDRDPPIRDQWVGMFPGTVVSAADPLRRGRLQVRAPQLYGAELDPAEDKIADADLPWAQPAFPMTGSDVGVLCVPTKGAGVWVGYWLSDPERPVWIGGFLGAADAPVRWTSSYGTDGPQTRLVRLPTGHMFEMRWVPGEEEIRIDTGGGLSFRMIDSPLLGGPKISLDAVGFKVDIDASPAGQTVSMQTPALNKVALQDGPTPSATINSPGQVNVTGGTVNVSSSSPVGTAMTTAAGASSGNFTGNQTLNFVGALALTVGGVYTLAVTGATTLTITGVLSLLAASVLIGAGIHRQLMDSRFADHFNSHTHDVTALAAPTSEPRGLIGGGPTAFPAQIGPIPPQTPLANVATTNLQAS